jgi:hypothetical protein
MDTPIVRIAHLALTNVKSVGYGEINFLAKKAFLPERSNVMGIYGQNASGKTTVVEALLILQALFLGGKFKAECLDYISCGKDSCQLDVTFSILTEGEQTNCNANYRCNLSEAHDPNNPGEKIICISSERLSFSGKIAGTSYVLQTIAETDKTDSRIRPDSKRKLLFGSDKAALDEIRLEKALALRESRSFLFSNAVFSKIRNEASTTPYRLLLIWIREFVKNNLFVVLEEDYGMQKLRFFNDSKLNKIGYADGINLWMLLGAGDRKNIYGFLPVPLRGVAQTDESLYFLLQKTLRDINPVLSSLVPGLNIFVNTVGKQTGGDGSPEYQIELFSKRRDCGEFPLRMESQGVRKMISILSLLIGVHNNPEVCLVVDELDGGVFEYLLGELLYLMENSGRGQLIFTSHNLRPLEMLGHNSVCFATNNPQERFTALKIKQSNNLRDVYYRNIGLGVNENQFYDGVNRYELGCVFRKVGRKE